MSYHRAITALADPTRRDIIEILRLGPSKVGELADKLPVSRPAVSQHLKILTDAGLASVAPKGAARHYRLNPNGADELRSYLDRLWGDALGAFQDYVTKKSTDD